MNKRQIAEEELKRALLMMKYDSRKTLSENKDSIKISEQSVGAVAAGSTAAGAALGAAAIPSTMSVAGGGAGAVAATTNLAAGVATTLGVGFTTGAAIVGGAAALAILPLAYWFVRKDTGADRIKKMIQMCNTEAAKIAQLEKKLSDSDYRDMADRLYDALEGIGTDEDAVYGVFKQVSDGTAADLCGLVNRFERENGSLFEWLDDDFDSPDEWRQIYLPMRNCVEDSLRELESKNPCATGEIFDTKQKKCVQASPETTDGKKTGGGAGGGGKRSGGGTYKTCTGTYTQGCKSESIKKIQSCLGLVADGKFGPKTQKALADKGFASGFTDDDVDKICKVQASPEPKKDAIDMSVDTGRDVADNNIAP